MAELTTEQVAQEFVKKFPEFAQYPDRDSLFRHIEAARTIHARRLDLTLYLVAHFLSMEHVPPDVLLKAGADPMNSLNLTEYGRQFRMMEKRVPTRVISARVY